ncbi:MAG: hypothetical protein ACOC5B_01495, partial [Myxococcota bacterium]
MKIVEAHHEDLLAALDSGHGSYLGDGPAVGNTREDFDPLLAADPGSRSRLDGKERKKGARRRDGRGGGDSMDSKLDLSTPEALAEQVERLNDTDLE